MLKFVKFYFTTFFLIVTFTHLFAQKNIILSGTIRDSQTGETLIGCSVKVNGVSANASISNAYGFYSLSIPEGHYQVFFSYVGYKTIEKEIDIKSDMQLDINLNSANELAEVVVTSEKRNDNVVNPQMGVQKLDVKDLKNIPVLFGERDILKTLQLLPGIKSAGEGNSG
ncbi:MAG: carboxypeptidase-like regulatory domain-containing protein, partial [Bacteroidetes bacterium]|nr:carboxypeptidase-like regulatory domain-containing protein [Bacteroidota bacterium]